MSARSNDQLPAWPAHSASRSMRATAKARPGRASKHLLEVNTIASTSGCAAISNGSAPKAGDPVDDHPPPRRPHRGADGGHVVDHAAAGLAVDHADMADGGIGGQRRGNRLRRGGRGLRDRQLDHRAAGLGRQADHPVGVGAGGGDEDPAAGGQEAAHGGLGHEMPAALQREGDVGVRHAARDAQQAGAHAEIKRAEIVVPGGKVLGQGGADFRPCGDRTGDQQQHGDLRLSGRCALARWYWVGWHVACHGREIHPGGWSGPLRPCGHGPRSGPRPGRGGPMSPTPFTSPALGGRG